MVTFFCLTEGKKKGRKGFLELLLFHKTSEARQRVSPDQHQAYLTLIVESTSAPRGRHGDQTYKLLAVKLDDTASPQQDRYYDLAPCLLPWSYCRCQLSQETQVEQLYNERLHIQSFNSQSTNTKRVGNMK